MIVIPYDVKKALYRSDRGRKKAPPKWGLAKR